MKGAVAIFPGVHVRKIALCIRIKQVLVFDTAHAKDSQIT